MLDRGEFGGATSIFRELVVLADQALDKPMLDESMLDRFRGEVLGDLGPDNLPGGSIMNSLVLDDLVLGASVEESLLKIMSRHDCD